MNYDYTEMQSGDDQQQARDLSLRHTRPPAEVPGYELTRFLGSGAYGEVWTGLDRKTGRQIAVKFYQHRGGVDWSLLSREVEKLVLLSADRYVVQLLDVGWQADPPYYVMEYIENGSLEKLTQQRIDQIVDVFREIATGLNHAHAKGILHCDLKPANVLIDHDNRPRLADFGQARLSDEQTASLGTLFYMAPEQADLEAIPDVRWDVYALGAILYWMLVGKPPHHNEQLLEQIEQAPDLPSRLRCYRQWISARKVPDEHRKLPGVDRALATIVDRCLQPRPSKRFSNVQSVVAALHAREQARARRPLLLLGLLGPIVLLVLFMVFGYAAYRETLETTNSAVIDQANKTNRYAASFAASSVASEIERYFRAVEEVATDAQLQDDTLALVEQLDVPLQQLATFTMPSAEQQTAKQEFLENPLRGKLQDRVNVLYGQLTQQRSWDLHGTQPRDSRRKALSLFVCGPRGTHLAGAFPDGSTATVGDNFAYRSYCHGGPDDLDEDARPLPRQHVRRTSLSSPLFSKVNKRWKIAVSTPIYRPASEQLLAIVVLSVEVNAIVRQHLELSDKDPSGYFPHFGVLVDGRDNAYQGMVFDHPLFREQEFQEYVAQLDKAARERLFSELRVNFDRQSGGERFFADPFARVEGGKPYNRQWLVASAPVVMEGMQAGQDGAEQTLYVCVQEDKQYALGGVENLATRLYQGAVTTLIGFLVIVGLLWLFVFYAQGGKRWWRHVSYGPGSSLASPTPNQNKSTAVKTPRGSQ
jgi:serine/threonine protein kinase